MRRGGSKKTFAFEIAHAQRRTFHLYADSEADLYSWLASLEGVITALRRRADAARDAVWRELVQPSLAENSSDRSSPRDSPIASPLASPLTLSRATSRERAASLESREASRRASRDDTGSTDGDDLTHAVPESPSSRRGSTRPTGGLSARQWATLRDDSLTDNTRRFGELGGAGGSVGGGSLHQSLADSSTGTGSPTSGGAETIGWRVLSAVLGARTLSMAHLDALRYLFFATVVPSTAWLDNPQASLSAVPKWDLSFVTRQQINYFSHVFGAHDKWFAICLVLARCYHGALSAARARTLLESAPLGSYLVRLVPLATAPLAPSQLLRTDPPSEMPRWPEAPHLVVHCRTTDGVQEFPVRREPLTMYHYIHGDTIWADVGAMITNTPILVMPYTAAVSLWRERFNEADKASRDSPVRAFASDVVTRRRIKTRSNDRRKSEDVDPSIVAAVQGGSGPHGIVRSISIPSLPPVERQSPLSHATSPRRSTVADQIKEAIGTTRRFTVRKSKSDVERGDDESATPSLASSAVDMPPFDGDSLGVSTRSAAAAEAQLELVKKEKQRLLQLADAKKAAEVALQAEHAAAAAKCPLTNAQLRALLVERRKRVERVVEMLREERDANFECAERRVESAIDAVRQALVDENTTALPSSHAAMVELRTCRSELRKWTEDDSSDPRLLMPLPFEARARHLWRMLPTDKAIALLDSGDAGDDDLSMGGSGFVPLDTNRSESLVLVRQLLATTTEPVVVEFLAGDESASNELRGRLRFANEGDTGILQRLIGVCGN